MSTRISRILAPTMIILAFIGIGSYLFKDPMRLLQMIFFYGLLFAAIYIIYRLFFRNKIQGTDRNYDRAVKQSMKRQKQKQRSRVKAPHLRVVGSNPNKLKTQKPALSKKNGKHNLTVIEGRKNKKRNRALF